MVNVTLGYWKVWILRFSNNQKGNSSKMEIKGQIKFQVRSWQKEIVEILISDKIIQG